ncbi:MAG: hypothetical protein E7113_04080 [Bacteroidales bacterium]|nr:hypothetical protein [Bacteroidales bacterium]
MKKIMFFMSFLLALSVSAAPVSEKRARQIASDFFSGVFVKSSGSGVELVWSGNDLNESAVTKSVSGDPLMYIYNNAGGDGFVIVSGDDNTRPVIAFSYDGSFDVEDMPGGARYILSGWMKQIGHSSDGPRMASSLYSEGSVVVSHSTASWGQTAPFNLEAPVIEGSHAVTGCVATALSIIAYHYRWPSQGVGTVPEYSYADRTVSANTLGRTYEYENMLSNYDGGYSETQGNAVAALMYDIGTAVKMQYGVSESGAFDIDVPAAMSTYFDYAKDMRLVYRETYSDSEWTELLKTALNAGPLYFSGTDAYGGGHAFVLDGYTDQDYFHINYGWNGQNNGYYYLPEQEFCENQSAIVGMSPDKSGTTAYSDHLLFTTASVNGIPYEGMTSDAVSYAPGTSFNWSAGAVYNSGIVDFNGSLALVLCNAEGNMEKTLKEVSVASLPVRYITVIPETQVTMPADASIDPGDRLRLYYKGTYSNDKWSWVRRSDSECCDEILVSATSADIAKSLQIGFSKTTRKLTFMSGCPLSYVVKDSSKNERAVSSSPVPAFTLTEIDMSGFASGEYDISFTYGETYTLTIVL